MKSGRVRTQRPVILDGKIMSRHIANEVLKQAKIKAKF